MKRILPVILFSIWFVATACGKRTPAPTQTASALEPTATFASVNPPQTDPADPPPEPTTPFKATESPNKPYDPSIFIIEASGTWRDELAPGYFADYEIETYLHKIDPNDNRAVTGAYEGVLWMKTTLDTEAFFQNMLGSAPVEINFDSGGEAVSDNFGIFLNTSDDKAWVDYAILDENGEPLPLTQDTPVARGSFVVVAKEVYLDALGRAVQGETLTFSTTEGSGDVIDINYVVHVQPNAMEVNGQRKVTFHFSGEGFNKTVEGVMRRIPGYREDVSEYLNSDSYQNSTWNKLRP